MQDTWLQALRPEDRVYISSSPSGWTATKEKAGRSYRLFILDGHGSHLTMDFIEYCHRNRVLLAVYLPHSTHTLQPLDVVMFKPFSSAYSNQAAAFMERCQGLTSMSKRDFYPMFVAACEAPIMKDTIFRRFNQPAQSGQSSDND